MKLINKDLAKWRKTRQRGKLYYIVVHSTLFRGFFIALLWSVGMLILGQGRLGGFLNILVIASIMFPVSNLFLGWWMWTWMERKYLDQTGNNGTAVNEPRIKLT